MAAQRGRLERLYVEATPSAEDWVLIGGQRDTGFDMTNPMVDVSNKDTGGWRKLGSDLGIRDGQMTVSGISQDDTALEIVEVATNGGLMLNYQLRFDNGDTRTGAFLCTKFSREGKYNGAEEYKATFESADEIVRVAG